MIKLLMAKNYKLEISIPLEKHVKFGDEPVIAAAAKTGKKEEAKKGGKKGGKEAEKPAVIKQATAI
jgi:hypothetical protein